MLLLSINVRQKYDFVPEMTYNVSSGTLNSTHSLKSDLLASTFCASKQPMTACMTLLNIQWRSDGWDDWKRTRTTRTGRKCRNAGLEKARLVGVGICSERLVWATKFLARNWLVRTNRRAIAIMILRPSVCPSETGVYCDHTMHFSTDLNLWLDSPIFWAPWHWSMFTYSKSSFFPVPPGREVGVDKCKQGVISQERLNYIDIKLYWVLIGSHYMPRRLAQQRMTLSDLEWPFHASRAISAVAELLVCHCYSCSAYRMQVMKWNV